jgi:hypothetical protein
MTCSYKKRKVGHSDGHAQKEDKVKRKRQRERECYMKMKASDTSISQLLPLNHQKLGKMNVIDFISQPSERINLYKLILDFITVESPT